MSDMHSHLMIIRPGRLIPVTHCGDRSNCSLPPGELPHNPYFIQIVQDNLDHALDGLAALERGAK